MAKKILIIEDERPIAHALELKLSKAGFEVKNVSNGKDGLDEIINGKFDLVLLDLVMPKLNGFGVLEEVKKRKIKTPIVVSTNLSQKEDEERARALGAKGFIVKSNTPITEIVEQIKKILNAA